MCLLTIYMPFVSFWFISSACFFYYIRIIVIFINILIAILCLFCFIYSKHFPSKNLYFYLHLF